DWPSDLNGKPEHPWKWTHFIYLMDVTTGEACTFSSNTNGGRAAFRDLTDQIRTMRKMKPGAVPIVALESSIMTRGRTSRSRDGDYGSILSRDTAMSRS